MSDSIFDKLLDGYVTIESAKLGGRLATQPAQQYASLTDIPTSSNINAASPTEKPFYKKPGVVVAGVVLTVVLIFAATRK